MKVLVTGSEGFVGKNLAPYLREKNINVVTLDLLPGGQGHIQYHLGKRVLAGQSEIIDSGPYDLVIHLASQSHVDRSISGPYPFVEDNVLGTLELFEILRQHHKGRVVLFSTDEVGACLEFGEFLENYEFNCGSTYSASKGAQELLAQAYLKTFNMQVLITRCVNIFGPHQADEKLIPTIIRKAMANESIPVYGNGMQMRQWVHVDHVCDFLNFLCVAEYIPPGKPLHITGTREIYNISMVRNILNILGKSGDLISYVKDRLGHDTRYALGREETDHFDCPKYSENSFDKDLVETVNWYKNKFERNQ